jgi:ABC-type multidrug transport system permease subunit
MVNLKRIVDKAKRRATTKNFLLGYSLFSILLMLTTLILAVVFFIYFPTIFNTVQDAGERVIKTIMDLFSDIFNQGG